MDFSQSFAISVVGMNIERARVDVAALNLANANTVQGVAGVSYQPLRVVADARAVAAHLAAGGTGSFAAMVRAGADHAGAAGQPVRVVSTGAGPRQVYEPAHPLADERGFVSYPGIDTATEMVSLMSATRAYEANVAAMNTTRTLALRALDIGGNQ